jgi:hypothetical protein
MMPLHSAFRRTVRRYVPQLSSDDLDRYESLVSFVNHLSVERGSLKLSAPTIKGAKKGKRSPSVDETVRTASHSIDPDIALLREEMNDILANYEDLYQKSRELWIARRQLAVQYGNFLQIPYTWRGLWLFLSANAKYRWVQSKNSFALSWNRLKYLWQFLTVTEKFAILVLFGLLAVSTWFVLTKLLTSPATMQ